MNPKWVFGQEQYKVFALIQQPPSSSSSTTSLSLPDSSISPRLLGKLSSTWSTSPFDSWCQWRMLYHLWRIGQRDVLLLVPAELCVFTDGHRQKIVWHSLCFTTHVSCEFWNLRFQWKFWVIFSSKWMPSYITSFVGFKTAGNDAINESPVVTVNCSQTWKVASLRHSTHL